jgi:hypothetical protein
VLGESFKEDIGKTPLRVSAGHFRTLQAKLQVAFRSSMATLAYVTET